MAKKENKPDSDVTQVPAESIVRTPAIGETLQRYAPPEERLAERMKARREELRLNYEELARMTAQYDAPDYKKGLTPAMLARYEKGLDGKAVFPGARELRLLTSALNVSADWLLLGIDSKDQGTEAAKIVARLGSLMKDIEVYPLIETNIWLSRAAEHHQKLFMVRKGKGSEEE